MIDFNQFDVIYTFEQDITVACNGDKCYFINVMGEIQREIPYISIRNVSLRKKGAIILYRENDVQVSVSTGTRFMLAGGEPMDGPRKIWWNFVASDNALMEKAKDDWKHNRFPTVPGDEEEFIPLPE